MYCTNQQYSWKDGTRSSTNISFFNFPKNDVNDRCRLIKRQNGRDNFNVSGSTRVCESHFEPQFIHKRPVGKIKRLKPGADHTFKEGT